MHLAWLSYWWKRMDREASKDSAEMNKRKEGERLLNYFASFSSLPKTQESGSVDILESGDVTKERHLVIDELSERLPTTHLRQGQGSLLRGSKRYVPGETSSPSKRKRNSGDITENVELGNPVSIIQTGSKMEHNKAENTQTNNPQSKILPHISSSTEFKSEIEARARDETENADQYKPGEAV